MIEYQVLIVAGLGALAAAVTYVVNQPQHVVEKNAVPFSDAMFRGDDNYYEDDIAFKQPASYYKPDPWEYGYDHISNANTQGKRRTEVTARGIGTTGFYQSEYYNSGILQDQGI